MIWLTVMAIINVLAIVYLYWLIRKLTDCVKRLSRIVYLHDDRLKLTRECIQTQGEILEGLKGKRNGDSTGSTCRS